MLRVKCFALGLMLTLLASQVFGQATLQEVDDELTASSDALSAGNTWYDYSANARLVANQVYGESVDWASFFANQSGPWVDAASAALARGDNSYSIGESKRALAIDPHKNTGTAEVILACNARNGTPPPVSLDNALTHATAAKISYLNYYGKSCEAYDWYADAAYEYAEAGFCAGRHFVRNGLFVYGEEVDEESDEEETHFTSVETTSGSTWTLYNGAQQAAQANADAWMAAGDAALSDAYVAYDLALAAYEDAWDFIDAGDAAAATQDYEAADEAYADAESALDDVLYWLNEAHTELTEAEEAYATAAGFLSE